MTCEYNKAIECNCTYDCPRHGKCCECIAHHIKNDEFPACVFSEKGEKAYDRSFNALVRDRQV